MISHHHRTIFVHIPKCAGQSIEHMFLEDLGLTWEAREPLLLRPNDDPDLGPPRLAHLLAADYVRCGHVSQEEFDSYFKFAIVRDPYDRALSMFNYLKVPRRRSIGEKLLSRLNISKPTGNLAMLDIDEFMTEYLPEMFEIGAGEGEDSDFWFVRKQADFVVDADGKLLVDEIIRLEQLNEKIAGLRKRCGLRSELRHVNKSSRKMTRQGLLPMHIDTIEALYKDDFDMFGYARHSS